MKFTSLLLSLLLLTSSLAHATQTKKSSKLASLEQASVFFQDAFDVPVRAYSTFDFGRQKDNDNISFVLPDKKAKASILKIQDVLADDLTAFIGTTNWLGEQRPEGVEVVIANIKDKFDVLAVARSNGINHGIDTKTLVTHLRQLDKALDIRIFHAESDTVGFSYIHAPHSYKALAEALYKLCPDLVDQGFGTIAVLQTRLEKEKLIYLWWD
ncbi:MAG: DUF4253 domain-containing protein [Psychrosphaera sp.]|nr:DUF4253 domain-containing protein [Psychrosphaera sp.]